MDRTVLLLEHPRLESARHYNDVANAPLSACLTTGYVAGMLRHAGLDVSIHDARLSGETFQQCFDHLRSARMGVLGVHAVYFWEETFRLFDELQALKSARPDIPLLLYGFFPTFAYRELLERYAWIDAVVVGEPESTILEVVTRAFERGCGSLEGIRGIAFSAGGSIRCVPQRPLTEEIDRLPFPVRQEAGLHAVGGSILGSRGCHGRCSFCCIHPFYGQGPCWRGRSAGNIAAEIEALMPRIANNNYIYFLDADFFGSGRHGRGRVLGIAAMLKGYGLEFGLECKSTDIEEDTVAALCAAGLRHVFLGIESGSSASLKRMQKGLHGDVSSRAVALLRRHGIEPVPGFIMFEPGSRLEDLRMNFEFLKSNRLLTRLPVTANVLYHREILLRGMPDFRRYESRGWMNGKDVLDYEGYYGFIDGRVGFLADLMSGLCRQVLMAAATRESPLYWKREHPAAARAVNDCLVALFDDVLGRLERSDIRPRGNILHELQANAWELVEKHVEENQA